MSAPSEGPLNLATESATLLRPSGVITLVEESSFCLSDAHGDIEPGRPDGLFVGDSRILSKWRLTVNGTDLELLGSQEVDPFTAVFVSRVRSTGGPDQLLVVRERQLFHGALRELISVRNLGDAPFDGALAFQVEADFADLFAVKEGKVRTSVPGSRVKASSQRWRFVGGGDNARGTEVWFSEPVVDDDGAAKFALVIEPAEDWEVTIDVAAILDGKRVEPGHPCEGVAWGPSPSQRLHRWRTEAPVVASDSVDLVEAVRRSIDDLGALRIFDPENPGRPVIAAGAPWFMTLFGRDSLLTSWMTLIVDPDLALAVVQTLARLQGTRIDPATEEEPGRILHEVRFGNAMSLSLGGGSIYYGTIDATPLFVMLLGELRRWGLSSDEVDALLPAADRALGWIEQFGDRDGDGYVEYSRRSANGLVNQGWKDSWDGIRFGDGSLAEAPIALSEVQGYVYAAYVARAHFADEAADASTAARYRERAEQLRIAFNRDFWIEDASGGFIALGLDRDKRPIDSVASNMGHCLWTGILDHDKAELVARRLLADDMFSGWGIRTMASSMAGYNPLSYHCGSVWPHDTALIASGLMRYGFVDEALTVVEGLLQAASAQQSRLPELFSGLSSGEVPFPVSYPSSCSPQAWASAAPLLCLRTLLRLDPAVPSGTIAVDPVLPETIRRLELEGIPVAGSRLAIRVIDGDVAIEGIPGNVRVTPRTDGMP